MVFFLGGGGWLLYSIDRKYPWKCFGIWNPLLPQIYKTEQCKSLCKKQIIFETRLNQSWVLTLRQNEYNHFPGYMSINQSINHVMSLLVYDAIHILYWSSYESSSPLTTTISMEVSHHGFFKIEFSELKYERKQVPFILKIFSLLYLYTHGAWEKKMYSLALLYFYRAVNVWAGF